MHTLLIICIAALWVVVIAMGFLLLGTLRSLGLLNWRLEELEATRPARVGRSGLKVGKKAPDFTLPDLGGRQLSLRDFSGRKLLLVFVQPGCGPCHAIVPELNRLHHGRDVGVLVVNNAEPEEAEEWAKEMHPTFPVAIQQRWEISKKYKIFATPFAYLVDEEGIIRSRGMAGSRQYLGYVLDGAAGQEEQHHADGKTDSTVEPATEHTRSSVEVSHV